ncbi:hypothetical protein R1sor_003255 [Riccia sorocarpa]|uniref:Transmembrane protein n=1 Tax=Riccia sorocarpa TaxID=122646 RepID=A0ABD3H116_9MARC
MADDYGSCTAACGGFWGFFGGAVASILFLIFGILAIIPSSPFTHRETTFGVVLIVLAVTGLATLVGLLVGGLAGIIIGGCLDTIWVDRSRKYLLDSICVKPNAIRNVLLVEITVQELGENRLNWCLNDFAFQASNADAPPVLEICSCLTSSGDV